MSFSKYLKEYLKEELKKIGSQMGSNSGGKFEDEHGNHFYRKEYRDGDQAKVEELTGKLYHKLGIKTVNPVYSKEDGKHTITTKWDDKIRPSSPSDYNKLTKDQANQLATMHHGAVLTKNWDIAGLDSETSNIMIHKDTGHFSSIDQGGSFRFRAQGGHKPYGPDIDEKETLKDPKHYSGQIFRSVYHQHPDAEIHAKKAVKNLDMEKVHQDFKNSGLNDWEELHRNVVERRKRLIS